MWSYEARRLFRDRLIGEKALHQFDAILNSVLRSDWSTDVSSLDQDGGALYVTWGSHASGGEVRGQRKVGQSLGRLSATDMGEIVAKALVAYGEYNNNDSDLYFMYEMLSELMNSRPSCSCGCCKRELLQSCVSVASQISSDQTSV